MTGHIRQRRGAAVAAVVLVLLTGHAAAAPALPPLEEQLRGNWYYTEVVIFQRPAVLDHLTEEQLARPPDRLRRDLRVFRTPDAPPSADFALDNATLPYLAFPSIDQGRLPDFAAAAAADAPREVEEPANQRPGGRLPPAIQPRLAADPLLRFLDVLADFEATLAADSYRWLPQQQFTLGNEAAAVARRGGYPVLMHGRWLQPVPPRDAPEPVYIQLGPQLGGVHALEGTLDVTMARYLHFRAELYYREPLLGQAPVNYPRPPAGLARPAPGRLLTADALEPIGFMQLRESRRLRSAELNYLDHPKLGVLVRIEPVTVPDDVRQAYEALRQSLEEPPQ